MLALVLAALGLAGELPAPLPPAVDDPAWQVVSTVDDVIVRRAHAPGVAAPWGWGEGEIAAPMERVIAHLTDFEGLVRWVPRLVEVRVIERCTDEAVVYFRFDLPWPVSDRDWTLRYRWRREGERFVMIWSDANDRGPPPGRALRVAPLRGRWELWPTGRGTTAGRYVFLAELGGRLPRSVVEQTAWKQPLQTFRGVRAATAAPTRPRPQ
jgi:uncharacterized protein YndB with AHSA1/START domain